MILIIIVVGGMTTTINQPSEIYGSLNITNEPVIISHVTLTVTGDVSVQSSSLSITQLGAVSVLGMQLYNVTVSMNLFVKHSFR
jgi:hypothetical protein